jgi:hypothetical protein
MCLFAAACGGASRPEPLHDVACSADRAGSLVDLTMQVRTSMSQAAGAGTNALVVPNQHDRDAFVTLVSRVLDGDDAAACLLPAPYHLIRLTDPTAGLLRVVVEQPAPSLFYGTYAANPAAQRELAVEAPHPLFDTNTEVQAASVFVEARARYLLVAGTHRCADAAASPCSGTTTVCGTKAPYRVTDAAHSELPFYAVHAALSTQHDSLWFLQLHGNGDRSCPDALVSDSSGTWSDAGPAGKLAAALTAEGVDVGKCGQQFPTPGCSLCGTDNIEARETAGASSACTQSGTSYGRFVHVEQHLSLRASPYRAMVEAVKAAF